VTSGTSGVSRSAAKLTEQVSSVNRAVSKTAESVGIQPGKSMKGTVDFSPGPIESQTRKKRIVKPKIQPDATPANPPDGNQIIRSTVRPLAAENPAKEKPQMLPDEPIGQDKPKKAATPFAPSQMGHQHIKEPQEAAVVHVADLKKKSSINKDLSMIDMQSKGSLKERVEDPTRPDPMTAQATPRAAPVESEPDFVAVTKDKGPIAPEEEPYVARVAVVDATQTPLEMISPEVPIPLPVELAVPVPEPQIQQSWIEKPAHSRHQSKGAHVHIGQVNVIVEAPVPSSRQAGREASSPPAGSSILLRGV